MSAKNSIKIASKQLNQLAGEKSPYLLQHATNPVDWYPWGDPAFEKARQEDKPIFLSIGYSTCHWCHVMEHESFEDPEVARLMNETFVSVKVDREERPDIDNIYMMVCQMITGSGGWPLTIIMTPDRKPFFAGTYIPRDNRFGQVGMLELVPRIKQIWATRRRGVIESAEKIAIALRAASSTSSGGELGEPILRLASEEFAQSFDRRFGGFGRAPKFPTPHNLLFLLRNWSRTGEGLALEMAERTLEAMRQGGIYDQLGFGFHRYSTDPQWLLPHFEKMLYDQALMATAYIEAYQATGEDKYAQTIRELFSYVLRDLADPAGGFYSAEDADSEGEEGKFYLWRADEIRKALAPEEAGLILGIFNVSEEGNFEDPADGQKNGLNILHYEKPISELAAEFQVSEKELMAHLDDARVRLLKTRNKRTRPRKDDKILTDWNGLMIAALASGARVLADPIYADSATKAARFILNTMRSTDGRLYHRYRDGEAGLEGNLDDYAFLIWGLLELYETTFEVGYLESALQLNAVMIGHFWDREDGGFFFTPDDAENLLFRQKEMHDGALPAGNSVAALNLLRLSRITGNSDFEDKAAKITGLAAGQVRRSPQAFTMLLSALEFALGPNCDVVIVGDPKAADTQRMLKAIWKLYAPNMVVILKPVDESAEAMVRLAPFIKDMRSIDGKATAYVCRNYTCEMPTTDTGKMLGTLTERNG